MEALLQGRPPPLVAASAAAALSAAAAAVGWMSRVAVPVASSMRVKVRVVVESR